MINSGIFTNYKKKYSIHFEEVEVLNFQIIVYMLAAWNISERKKYQFN